jgi:hypothetical protein
MTDDEQVDWAALRREEARIDRIFDNMPIVGPVGEVDCPADFPHHHSDGATCLRPSRRNDPQPGHFEPGRRWPVTGSPDDIVASCEARRRYWQTQGLTPGQAADAALFELHGRGPRRVQPPPPPEMRHAGFASAAGVTRSCRSDYTPLNCLIRYPIEVRAG